MPTDHGSDRDQAGIPASSDDRLQCPLRELPVEDGVSFSVGANPVEMISLPGSYSIVTATDGRDRDDRDHGDDGRDRGDGDADAIAFSAERGVVGLGHAAGGRAGQDHPDARQMSPIRGSRFKVRGNGVARLIRWNRTEEWMPLAGKGAVEAG
jgi:hypothetical protein